MWDTPLGGSPKAVNTFLRDFFLKNFFGVFTLGLCCYQHPCQVSSDRDKGEMVATFIVKSEAFMQRMISLIFKAGIPRGANF
jgi:hypothetical protein